METIPDYQTTKAAITRVKKRLVSDQLKALSIGDPIAVEIGSTETHMIVLYTFYMGLTQEGKVRFINVNPVLLTPELLVEDVEPERVRPHSYIDGFKRDGLFAKAKSLNPVS